MDLESVLELNYLNNVHDKLDVETSCVLKNYSCIGYICINGYLNGDFTGINFVLNNKCILEKNKRKIRLIREGIKKSPLPLPITVFHGIKNIDYTEGCEIIKTKSFLSTSIKESIASTYRNVKLGLPVLEIHLPKGYPALWMGNISLYHSELEVLLSDHIELEKEEKVEHDGYTLIKTRVI